MLTSVEWSILYGLYQESVSLDVKISNLAKQGEFGVCDEGKELSKLNTVRQYMQDRIEEIERKMNETRT
jgi:hypothetical protein